MHGYFYMACAYKKVYMCYLCPHHMHANRVSNESIGIPEAPWTAQDGTQHMLGCLLEPVAERILVHLEPHHWPTALGVDPSAHRPDRLVSLEVELAEAEVAKQCRV